MEPAHFVVSLVTITIGLLPEFVAGMQARLAGRLLAQAQQEIVESEIRFGTIPSGVAGSNLKELTARIGSCGDGICTGSILNRWNS